MLPSKITRTRYQDAEMQDNENKPNLTSSFQDYLICDADHQELGEHLVDGAHHRRRLPAGQAQQRALQQGQACLDCLESN